MKMKVQLDAQEIIDAIVDYIVKRKGYTPKLNKNDKITVRLDISDNTSMESLTATIDVEDK